MKSTDKDGKISFEEALEALQSSVDKLEVGEISLEEALQAYEKGIKWGKECEDLLSQAEERVLLLEEGKNGNLEEADFLKVSSSSSSQEGKNEILKGKS